MTILEELLKRNNIESNERQSSDDKIQELETIVEELTEALVELAELAAGGIE